MSNQEKCPTCDTPLEPDQPGMRWCPTCEVVIYGYSEDFEVNDAF